MSDEPAILENARSVANAELPPPPKAGDPHFGMGSILLFYQYKEPEWTDRQHKQVLKDVIALGTKCGISGRGRVAPEGLNCTLSGQPNDIRSFCQALRDYDPLFLRTDFKITDGIPLSKTFKNLSIRKTKELVAYGLAGRDKAPSLQKFAGTHLTATDYHAAIQDKDTVIIDVRNAYESAIGRFSPPEGGAELIDPKMRNSIEFPKWLADERTQKKLNNKKVLMYCTGGIRCERATALLNQMASVNPQQCKPKGVYELQGGIERYVKTYPQGGFWKGKNYLFDRRMEQIPGNKSETQSDAEITDCACVVCHRTWSKYRGKFTCSRGLCGVPVIVCDDCKESAKADPQQLICRLCREGYKAPQLMPDLVGMKRRARDANQRSSSSEVGSNKRSKTALHDGSISNSSQNDGRPVREKVNVEDRLFLARLPLTATKTKIEESLGGTIKVIRWLADKKTGGFYGSCIVQLASAQQCSAIMQSKRPYKIDRKKIRLSYCQVAVSTKVAGGSATSTSARVVCDDWPPADYVEREYPPIGRW